MKSSYPQGIVLKYKALILAFICLSLSWSISFGQTTYTFNGTVNGAIDEDPLIGAAVQINGTGYGGITDFEGKYMYV